MLEAFTDATFLPHVGEPFRLSATTQLQLTMILSEVTRLGSPDSPAAGQRRAPFSLLFHGPTTPLLAQRIYRVEHGAIGAFDLFLVPLGPDREGQRYEAVFG